MKIITYSDLHLEFKGVPPPVEESDADLMILAGDIFIFGKYAPLQRLLEKWQKPVLMISGNHEYYNRSPMKRGERYFREWLARHYPNVTYLQNESITTDGVNFFGGTMWTDFNQSNPDAMAYAGMHMNDYRLIYRDKHQPITPEYTVELHNTYVKKLTEWFENGQSGKRVVISHHAPTNKVESRYGSSTLVPAYNSLDMLDIITKYQPAVWVHGHTHECDSQMIGSTRIISNQRGYPLRSGGFECAGFDPLGLPIEV